MKQTTLIFLLVFSLTVHKLSQATENLSNVKNQNINTTKTALIGATVLSPHLEFPIKDAVVLINNGKIEFIGQKGMKIQPSYKKIDITGRWLVPGYIDSHIHLFQSAGAFTRPDLIDYSNIRSYKEDYDWIRKNLNDTFARYLSSGVTSAVDMGGPNWNFKIRDKANNMLYAPQLAVAGPLISPITVEQLDMGDPPIIKASSTAQAVDYVKQQLKQHPNLIKIWWVRRPELDLNDQIEMFTAAIDLAHKNNVRVAVHAFEMETAKEAIKAGADILVHGVVDELVDDEFINLMKQAKVIYIPTLIALTLDHELYRNNVKFTAFEIAHSHPDIINSYRYLAEHKSDYQGQIKMIAKYIPYVDASDDKLEELSEGEKQIVGQIEGLLGTEAVKNNIQKQSANLLKVYHAGITIALGTDAGNPAILHGASIFREMGMLYDAGIPLSGILAAISANGAKVMGKSNELGSVEVGKTADFVILEKNPLENIDNFSSIMAVMKQGNYLTTQQINSKISKY
jgi:imidazolonepropionase-like amidohydrolase